MRRQLITFFCLCCLPLTLVSCLPGKEKEKETIAQAQQATHEVQVEKISADMANAARDLMSSATATAVASNNLKTISCNSDHTHVIAYVPASATFARNGALPPVIASQLRDALGSRFKPEDVHDAGYTGCGTITDIAVNSPVLSITVSMSALVNNDNNSPVTSVTMDACPNDANGNRIPGVIVHKTMAGNPVPIIEDHCGRAAPTDAQMPDITLDTNGRMPDWKAQLTGTPGATTSFTCIASTAGCTPVIPNEPGFKLVCPSAPKEEMMVNPGFDNASYQFVPSASTRSCGKGWSGQLIARMKKRECQVYRKGVLTSEKPAIVYDVGYIGAKCTKDDLRIEDLCPAGTPLAGIGKMVTGKKVDMNAFVSLSPVASGSTAVSNQNIISYYNTTGPAVSTNASADIQQLVASPQVVTVRDNTGAVSRMDASLFFSRRDLNGLSQGRAFDTPFTQELFDLNKSAVTPSTCYTTAQSCMKTSPPDIVTVLVDRSGSMSMNTNNTPTTTPNITPQQTSCRATMANLFKKENDQRKNACIAAKEWQNIMNSVPNLRQQALQAWNNNNDPTYQGSAIYQALVTDVDQNVVAPALAAQKQIMTDALIDPTWEPRLQNGLAIGQDCYPARVQDDTYGNCAPEHASVAELVRSDFTIGPLKMCQSGCPGECITDAVSRVEDVNGNHVIDNGEDAISNDKYVHAFTPSVAMPTPTAHFLPVSTPSYRMKTADSFIMQNLMSNLPPKAKLVYMEFVDGEIDMPNKTGGHKVVEINLDDPGNPNADPNMINTKALARKAMNAIYAKSTGRPNTGGGTPLFESIDRAFDNTFNSVFASKGNNAPAVIVIVTDGDDNGDPSELFGTNLCGLETKPIRYQCERTHFIGGSDYRDIDEADVARRYGYSTMHTRDRWCYDTQNFKDHIIHPYGSSGSVEQVNSFVGFIGRNFPNTQVFYLDLGNTTIGNQCGRNENQWYPKEGVLGAKRILHVFKYDDNAGDAIVDAFDQSMGGNGKGDPVAGARICKLKWGNNIVTSDVTIPETPLGSVNPLNVHLPDCKIDYVQVINGATTFAGNGLLPPGYVPNPVIPPPHHGPYGNGTHSDCIDGYEQYTGLPCVQ